MNLQSRVDTYRERKFPTIRCRNPRPHRRKCGGPFHIVSRSVHCIGRGHPRAFLWEPEIVPRLGPSGVRPLPKAEDIQAVVSSRIQALAEIFGLGQPEFRLDIADPDFIKHWVLANQKPLFSIDLTRIGGNVHATQIVKKTITDTPEITVLTPNANYLLFQKCETFLGRRNVKARDAFDMHLLLSRGAQLDNTLRPHLEDFILIGELDEESIKGRIEAVSPKLCTVELRPVLPLPLFEQLGKEGFEPIRQSLRTVFSDWLEGGRR